MVRSLITGDDLHFFNEGTHSRLYERFGAHVVEGGVCFAVWAPNAKRVSVVGDFNHWSAGEHALSPEDGSGVWTGFVAGAAVGQRYKYDITSRVAGYHVQKADPIGAAHEVPPKTASIISAIEHEWGDAAWMQSRADRFARDAPVSIYELHLGSWRHPGGELPNYRAIASHLADYVSDLGFTHIELMPVMEHPFYGSWGYQVTGYFAPASRYGSPADLMHMIDVLHQRGIGVILDWVPAHFPTDEHGLGFFDGTHLYEHADPRKGFHPDWTTFIYNYDRNEVKSFLLSSASMWLERYHVDGLRVDGVASMLYLDYSRKDGEWVPNADGSNHNRGAIEFLQRLNETLYRDEPGCQTIAEESTAWTGVSRPTSGGGLGFGYKWDMGWMHDTLAYMEHDPVHRSHHQDQITFRAVYQYTENYVLPLSHDEVVHGKGSLYSKMPGDPWQKLANLRLLFGYQFGVPGKKLQFMGNELATPDEWNHEVEVPWHLADDPAHRGIQNVVRDLNKLYRGEPALYLRDVEEGGFEWIDFQDRGGSVLAFLRLGDGVRPVAVVCNFTPVPRDDYRVGVPTGGAWRELLNTDAALYGGGNVGNLGAVIADPEGFHGRPFSLRLRLPPLACVFLAPEHA